MRHGGRLTPEIRHRTGADRHRAAVPNLANDDAIKNLCFVAIPRGVYRFKSNEEADAQMQEGPIRAVILSVQANENREWFQLRKR